VHTCRCQELLVQQEQEGLSHPTRTRIVTLPDFTSGKHLECTEGHTIHLGGNGETWPCDCYAARPPMKEGFRNDGLVSR
jgi:hypothetical protein